MLYSYARLSNWDFSLFRFLGPGLGNLLFPWARFILATQRYGLTPIFPTWPQIKLGPILRREPDVRFYFDLFNKNPEEISGFRKAFCLFRHSCVAEGYLENLKTGIQSSQNETKIIIFEGLGDYFNPLIREHSLINNELLKITRNEHKKGLDFDFNKSISVHIRLGDFKGWRATPIRWYLNTLLKLRSEVGPDWPIYIFSDGTDEELMSVMRLPNAKRLTFGSSLADLLALSKAHLLIGSAASTFSQWASFLGRMPVIWPSGSLKQRLYYDNTLSEIEYDYEDNLPDGFIQHANKTWNRERTIYSSSLGEDV